MREIVTRREFLANAWKTGFVLVGVAGATYSLSVKLGWKEDLAGEGWIALAIVIFGLWVPGRVALGAYRVGGG